MTKGALELVCVRCTRARWFVGESQEAAGREAERKGWALIKGKVYCNRCPHPFKDPPPKAPELDPNIKRPIRMESANEIIARLTREGYIVKNGSGLVRLSPAALAMPRPVMAQLMRPQGIYA